MSPAIPRIVAAVQRFLVLGPALLLQTAIGLPWPGGVAVEGGADGFPGAEIAMALPNDACLEWGLAGSGFPAGSYWGGLAGGAEGGIEAAADAAADAEGREGWFLPQGIAWRPIPAELASCGAGGASAVGPIVEAPVWTPFAGAALDDGDPASEAGRDWDRGMIGGVVWVGAFVAPAFSSLWPGMATVTPRSVADGRLASPASGGDGGQDDSERDGTGPEAAATLVVATPPPRPGAIAAVMPEPGMLLMLGIAIAALAMVRRARA